MLRLLLLFLLINFFSIILLAQKITLKGQVSIHNSKYETGTIRYVSNAYASAPFAGSDDTDDLGKFGLTFTGIDCLLYTSPSPRDATLSRMPSSA